MGLTHSKVKSAPSGSNESIAFNVTEEELNFGILTSSPASAIGQIFSLIVTITVSLSLQYYWPAIVSIISNSKWYSVSTCKSMGLVTMTSEDELFSRSKLPLITDHE